MIVTWCPEMLATLDAMRAARASWDAIGCRIGVSAATASKIGAQRGWPSHNGGKGKPGHHYFFNEALARQLHAQGMTQRDAAVELGISPQMLRHRSDRIGLVWDRPGRLRTRPFRPLSAAHKAAISAGRLGMMRAGPEALR